NAANRLQNHPYQDSPVWNYERGPTMMQRKRKSAGSGPAGEGSESGLGGILKGLGDLVEKLGDLAEKGETLSRSGEFSAGKGLRGVYGFSAKGLPGSEGFKVEPFGNIARDNETGPPVVGEAREPVVDVFEEAGHVLVVAEMAGIGSGDVKVE